ncbi:protein POOR HOMOLOGOUS SYNAPSIS 1-like [Carex rostrata]
MAKTKRKQRISSTAAKVKVSFSPKSNPSMRSNMKGNWKVEYSRFFTVPSVQAPVIRSQPLHRSKRSKGTWLPCHTTASLSISLALIPGGSAVHVLSLSLGDDLIEEHVLYNLLFSWPQVACVPECPIRGSRAVFISFKDTSAQALFNYSLSLFI